jgi:pimeloyl-ACP methyl ester carboxylesterase
MSSACPLPQQLHYLTRGSGEPLLLVHGLGSSGADWHFQVQALESSYRVIVPDLPGCGHSRPPSEGYTIAGFASSLWSLLDSLEASNPNIVGFSLGGAVALEMALQRPQEVPRLVLINSLACYRVDHWRKWLEARLPFALMHLLGMRRAATLLAARMFPDPWQQAMRERAVAVIGAFPRANYLAIVAALESWTATRRLDRLRSRVLMIAAEFDLTPLTEKRRLARELRAELVVIRGSRHGTPFDAVTATNACLLACLGDGMLPPEASRARDGPQHALSFQLAGSITEEHAGFAGFREDGANLGTPTARIA